MGMLTITLSRSDHSTRRRAGPRPRRTGSCRLPTSPAREFHLPRLSEMATTIHSGGRVATVKFTAANAGKSLKIEPGHPFGILSSEWPGLICTNPRMSLRLFAAQGNRGSPRFPWRIRVEFVPREPGEADSRGTPGAKPPRSVGSPLRRGTNVHPGIRPGRSH